MIKIRLSALLLFTLLILNGASIASAAQCADDDVACWLQLLERNDPQALTAAMKLGALQSEEAIPALLKKLESKDQYMATAAVHALIRIGKPAVLPLVKATKSEKPCVRRYATYALGRIGNGEAYDAVLAMAKDQDHTVRGQAAEALGLLNDQRTLMPLFELLRDQHVSVRVEAARSLAIYKDKRSVYQLINYGLCDLSPEVAREATRTLVAVGEPAVADLIETYNSRPSFVRMRILIALGNIAVTAQPQIKKQVVDTCITVVKRKSDNEEVRAVAAFTLGSLEAQDAISALQQVMTETQTNTPEGEKLAAACKMALDKINKTPSPPQNE